MTKREKRLEAIKENPRGVRPEELEQVLLDAGFIREKGKGDHRNYNCGKWNTTIDFGRDPVRSVYVKEVIAIIEAMRKEEAESRKEKGE